MNFNSEKKRKDLAHTRSFHRVSPWTIHKNEQQRMDHRATLLIIDNTASSSTVPSAVASQMAAMQKQIAALQNRDRSRTPASKGRKAAIARHPQPQLALTNTQQPATQKEKRPRSRKVQKVQAKERAQLLPKPPIQKFQYASEIGRSILRLQNTHTTSLLRVSVTSSSRIVHVTLFFAAAGIAALVAAQTMIPMTIASSTPPESFRVRRVLETTQLWKWRMPRYCPWSR